MPLNNSKNTAARLLAIVIACVLLGSGSMAFAQDVDDLENEISQAKIAKKEASAEKAAAAAQVDLIKAEDLEVKAHLDDITAAVGAQEATVEAARVSLKSARREVKSNERRERRIAQEIEAAAAKAKRFAVDAYVGTADETPVWLESSDLSHSARKVSYLDVVNQDRDDAFDELRQLRADQLDTTEAARDARAREKQIKLDRNAQLVILEERKLVQERLQADVERRLEEWEASFEDFNDAEDELGDLIRAKEAALETLLNPPPRNGWHRPTAGAIGSGFGPRRHPILGYTRPHNGVDMSGGTGARINAAADGEVIHAGRNGGCGNTVIIAHGGGLTSVYCHQANGAIRVSVGERVTGGQQIGGIGSTGLSTGPHLHFEIRENGVPVDPLNYI